MPVALIPLLTWGATALGAASSVATIYDVATSADGNAESAEAAAIQARTAAEGAEQAAQDAAAAAGGAASQAGLDEISVKLGYISNFLFEGYDLIFQGDILEWKNDPRYPGAGMLADAISSASQASANAFIASVNAQDAKEAAEVVQQIFEGIAPGLARYTLDAAGLAAFDADVLSGDVLGSGLIVQYQIEPGVWVPSLNPHFLTIVDPNGDEVFDSRLLLDVINGLYLG